MISGACPRSIGRFRAVPGVPYGSADPETGTAEPRIRGASVAFTLEAPGPAAGALSWSHPALINGDGARS